LKYAARDWHDNAVQVHGSSVPARRGVRSEIVREKSAFGRRARRGSGSRGRTRAPGGGACSEAKGGGSGMGGASQGRGQGCATGLAGGGDRS